MKASEMRENRKPLVVLLGRADWAGSCYSVSRAINQTGRMDCRHVSLYPHIFGFPADIVIPICNVPHPGKATDYPREYEETQALFQKADIIHIWNDLPHVFDGLLPVPQDKIRSCTFTGTLYRQNHVAINRHLKARGLKLAVQNPTYRFPDEYDAEFIPHAVDISKLIPLPIQERESGSIGCYRPEHRSTSAHADITLLESQLGRNHPDWHITLDKTIPWEERMRLMPRCRYFFEYMDANMGYWGRSALEACAMGVPTFSFISEKALAMSQGRIGRPAVIHVTGEILEKTLLRYLNLDPEEYKELSLASRAWIENYYSYQAVGELYSRFFESLANQGQSKSDQPGKLILKVSAEPAENEYSMPSRTLRHEENSVGRNDPCPCGSGLKYKKCCLAKTTA